ncbi:hypothetical protein HY642_05030 [Candidatus Woesearchaeota archaeon]|nr:hypothetical protein [Candidatus Woesearchaeota archaeon]
MSQQRISALLESAGAAATWRAATLLRSQPWMLLLMAFLDGIFLLLYGFFTQPIRDKIVVHGIIIGNILSQNAQEASREFAERQSVVTQLLAEPIRPYAINTLLLLGLLVVAVYLVYIVFQGLNWHFAGSLKGHTSGATNYVKKFASINAFWFVLFAAQNILSLVAGMRSIAVEKLTEQPAPVVLTSVAAALFYIILYFAVLSYAFLLTKPAWQSIKAAFKHGVCIHKTIGWAAVVVLVIAAINYLLVWLNTLSPAAWFVAGAFLLLPALSWIRLSAVMLERDA